MRDHRTADQPLLLIGATGTLGRALHRVGRDRGLVIRCVGRAELDITDDSEVSRVVETIRPWAVINAAGYVRVDEAEREAATCLAVNTMGALHIARACQQFGLPLAYFSTDQVFDGRQVRPYVETDQTRPLNVYGASKAQAERQIAKILPGALIIRTSAFFGPWDDSNFIVQMLNRTSRGEVFAAAPDVIVSPTYVPDLAHATLDLLIAHERGIWHLANTGEMSWYEFACTAAALLGRRPDLVVPVAGAAMGHATRPAYSALGSERGQLMRPLADALDACVAEVRKCRRHRQVASLH